MKEFISKYADRIHGVLSCFDRMLFRGYLPIMSGWQMAQFFNNSNIHYRELKPFLLEHFYGPLSLLLAQNLAQKFLSALGWILAVGLRFVRVALPKQSPEHTERIVGCWHNPFQLHQ